MHSCDPEANTESTWNTKSSRSEITEDYQRCTCNTDQMQEWHIRRWRYCSGLSKCIPNVAGSTERSEKWRCQEPTKIINGLIDFLWRHNDLPSLRPCFFVRLIDRVFDFTYLRTHFIVRDSIEIKFVQMMKRNEIECCCLDLFSLLVGYLVDSQYYKTPHNWIASWAPRAMEVVSTNHWSTTTKHRRKRKRGSMRTSSHWRSFHHTSFNSFSSWPLSDQPHGEKFMLELGEPLHPCSLSASLEIIDQF